MIGHVLHSADNTARLPHLCSDDDDDDDYDDDDDDDEQNFDDDNAASLINLCTVHVQFHLTLSLARSTLRWMIYAPFYAKHCLLLDMK